MDITVADKAVQRHNRSGVEASRPEGKRLSLSEIREREFSALSEDQRAKIMHAQMRRAEAEAAERGDVPATTISRGALLGSLVAIGVAVATAWYLRKWWTSAAAAEEVTKSALEVAESVTDSWPRTRAPM